MIFHREKKIAALEQAIAAEENELFLNVNEKWPGMFDHVRDEKRWSAREMKGEKENQKEQVEEMKTKNYYSYYNYNQDDYDDAWPE